MDEAMFNTVFKVLYFVLFVVATVVRKVFTSKNRKHHFVKQYRSKGDIALLAFDGLGMTIPLVYVWSGLLDFANYTLPTWTGWLGAVLFAYAIYLLYQSHAHLGKNWSPILGIKEEHYLVTSGIYRFVRHPMYSAHLLWAVAQVLMLHNWIAGFSFLVVMVPHILYRVPKEEALLIEQFGDQYRAYQASTGMIMPRFGAKRRG